VSKNSESAGSRGTQTWRPRVASTSRPHQRRRTKTPEKRPENSLLLFAASLLLAAAAVPLLALSVALSLPPCSLLLLSLSASHPNHG